MSWDDEDGPDNFFELRMDKSHITNDYVLTITDFAWEDEVDSLKTIWNDNLARLRNSSGI
ncbi:START-like domain-containing protein [Hoylesella shahii]|uniref:START-like domain-containing protein n=1 Tax=Hoylesella shahii TaxID=228603 RepID=UPI0021D2BEC4|nr:START-like domain-containing protein [Hoylesella shahii]